MRYAWRTFFFATTTMLGLIAPKGAVGDISVSGSFGPNGDIGFVTSPPSLGVTFGPDSQGYIYQMDAFVNVPSANLGAGTGVSADLANGAPTGVSFTFSATQPTADQLLLSYQFVNNTTAALPSFQFLYFINPSIGENFADEWATTSNTSTLGLPGPTSYQIGDPSLSSIFTNLALGTLSNGNDFPTSSQAGDVSVALGFTVSTLAVGQTATVDVLLSDNGTSLGGFTTTEHSPDIPGDLLTISGAVVPEPSSLILLTVGSLMGLTPLVRRTVRRRQACTRSQ